MKVLMICTVPLSGNGIATCVLNYAGALASQMEMHILAPEGVPADTRDKLTAAGIGLHQLPNRKTGVVQYVIALWKHLKKGRYDIVHIHGNSCTISIELLAAALAGIPVRIAHSHNTSCQHMKAHRLLRPVFELCVNGRLACGREAGKWLFHKKEFSVLRNGIDLSRYGYCEETRKEVRGQLGLAEDTLVLGHVGLFVPAKNHPFLLQIAEEMKKRGKQDWKLLLLGDGDGMEQFRQSVAQSNVSDRVLLLGSVPDTSGYLQAMDVFLLPSIHEGLPFVLVEAQAAGLKALVSDQVSREADLTGLLRFLPISQEGIWVDALEAMSPQNRQQQSENACTSLQEAGYSIAGNGQFLFDYYTALLQKKR